MVSESNSGLSSVGGGPDVVDGLADRPSLLTFDYHDDPNRVVATEGDFVVVHMKFMSRAWLEELWEQVQQHRSLFWEPQHSELENFVDILLRPGWLFFEVYKFGHLVGFFYFTNVDMLTDIQIHGVSFDRKLQDKVHVVRRMLWWLFENYHIQRVEAAIPRAFRGTVRFLDAVGFRLEGVRRLALIYNGRWKDQAIYSVTREEVCRF